MNQLATAIIESSGLTRRFGKRTAVDHIDLYVPRETIYGFLGPNGAGKTTTIRLLLGLLRADEGQVKLFGFPRQDHGTTLLQRVGALVETPSLYPHLTGRENLEVTRRLVGAPYPSIARVLAIVGLERDAHRCVREYSLGMRQRLGLALALLNQPALLVLDEPMNGLDPAGICEIRELVRSFPKEHGITVFLSSHLLNEVEQVASHVGIIHKGRLLFQGTLGELHDRREGRIRLRVSQPDRAFQIVEHAGWVMQWDGSDLIVKASSPVDAASINALLVDQGLNVFHLAIEPPSLEDIFLHLTNTEPAKGNKT